MEIQGFVNAQNENSLTSLLFVAENGHLDLVKYLTEAYGNVNFQGESGCTPLTLATKNGHLDIETYLTEQPWRTTCR